MSHDHGKNLLIVDGETVHDRVVHPGTTAADILADIGATGDVWLANRAGVPFGGDENLYTAIRDGEKVILTPAANVATALNPTKTPPWNNSPIFPPVLKTTGHLDPQRKKATFQSALEWTRVMRTYAPPKQVTRNTRPFELERGWFNTTSGMLTGYYKTRKGRPFEGRISASRYGQPEFYVHDPVGHLKNGPHSACFNECDLGRDWYRIHFSPTPNQIATGIIAVEKLIRETFAC